MYFLCYEALNVDPVVPLSEAEVALALPKALRCCPTSRSTVASRILQHQRCSESLVWGLIPSSFPSCTSALRVWYPSERNRTDSNGSVASMCKHLPYSHPHLFLVSEGLSSCISPRVELGAAGSSRNGAASACAFLRVAVQTQLELQAALPALQSFFCVPNPHGCVSSPGCMPRLSRHSFVYDLEIIHSIIFLSVCL